MDDPRLPDCSEHEFLLGALKAELTLLLDYMRRESEISGSGAENTLRAIRVEVKRPLGRIATAREHVPKAPTGTPLLIARRARLMVNALADATSRDHLQCEAITPRRQY